MLRTLLATCLLTLSCSVASAQLAEVTYTLPGGGGLTCTTMADGTFASPAEDPGGGIYQAIVQWINQASGLAARQCKTPGTITVNAPQGNASVVGLSRGHISQAQGVYVRSKSRNKANVSASPNGTTTAQALINSSIDWPFRLKGDIAKPGVYYKFSGRALGDKDYVQHAMCDAKVSGCEIEALYYPEDNAWDVYNGTEFVEVVSGSATSGTFRFEDTNGVPIPMLKDSNHPMGTFNAVNLSNNGPFVNVGTTDVRQQIYASLKSLP